MSWCQIKSRRIIKVSAARTTNIEYSRADTVRGAVVMKERAATAEATTETRSNRPRRDDFGMKKNWENKMSSVWPDGLLCF